MHNIKCITPSCNGKVGQLSITKLCKKCYSSIYSWTKKTSEQQNKRANDIQLYAARLNLILPKNKIRMINGSKSLIRLDVIPGQCAKYRKKTKYKIKK